MSVTPASLLKELDDAVVGQKEAKKALALALFLHTVRILYAGEKKESLRKTNILLMGPTGVGKTLLIKTIDKSFWLPIFEINATEISQRGWKGRSFDEYLNDFYKEVGGKQNKHMIENGVIFIDEFDKVCMPNFAGGSTDHNKIIQHSLLKAIEGTTVTCDNGTKIDTTQILFILAGNFETIRAARKEEARSMGFLEHKCKKNAPTFHTELIKYGVIEEIAGRISAVAELHVLTRAQMKDAFMSVDNNILSQYQKLWKYMNSELVLSEYRINSIIDECLSNKTGARGLQSALDNYLKNKIFKLNLDDFWLKP